MSANEERKKGAHNMPGRRDRSAPEEFTGQTGENMVEFLDLFEILAEAHSLREDEMCRALVVYTDIETRQLLKTFPSFRQNNWKEFRKRLLEFWPSTDYETKYSRHELHLLAEEWNSSEVQIKTRLRLEEMNRKFYAVSSWLLERKRITEDQVDYLYWTALGPEL